MRLITVMAIILCGLLPRGSSGQFSTNLWPSWRYDRQDVAQLQQAWSAAVERCSAVNVSPPAQPSWMRPDSYDLQLIKDSLKLAVIEYINSTNADGAGSYETFMALNPALDAPPDFTLDALCRAAHIPVNWFDWTPWRCLNGRGGYTFSIDSIGHPHGETNSITAAGGTYFPDGRTNWVTTDYGYDSVTSVVAWLVHWKRDITFDDETGSGGKWAQHIDLTNDLAKAQDDLIVIEWPAASPIVPMSYAGILEPNRFTPLGYPTAWNQYYNYADTPDLIYAVAMTVWNTFAVDTITWTNRAHIVDLYEKATDLPTPPASPPTLPIFYAWSEPITWNQYLIYDRSGPNTTNSHQFVVGDDSYAVPAPPWQTVSPVPSQPDAARMGWVHDSAFSVVRWDVMGGFLWR